MSTSVPAGPSRPLAVLLDGNVLSREDVYRIADRAQERATKAAETSMKRLLSIAFLWFVSFAVSANVLSEGEVFAFKLRDLTMLLLVTPILIALLFHDTAGLASIEIACLEIVGACNRYLYPELPESTRTLLRISVGTLDSEAVIADRAQGVSARVISGTYPIIAMLILLGPVVILAHVVYLMFASAGDFKVAKIAVVVVVVGILLRAVTIWIAEFEAKDATRSVNNK